MKRFRPHLPLIVASIVAGLLPEQGLWLESVVEVIVERSKVVRRLAGGAEPGSTGKDSK